jgi:hypothetical protein
MYRMSISKFRVPLSTLLFLSLLLIFALESLIPQKVNGRVLTTHTNDFNFSATAIQVRTYVGVICAFMIIIFFFPKWLEKIQIHRTRKNLFEEVSIFLCFLIGLILQGVTPLTKIYTIICVVFFILMRTKIGSQVIYHLNKQKKKISVISIFLILSVFIIKFIVPLLHFIQPTYAERDLQTLAYSSSHYAFTVLSGFETDCCTLQLSKPDLAYGLSMPFLSFIVLKLTQFFYVDATYYDAIRVLQLIGVLLLAFLITLVTAHRKPIIFLISLLIIPNLYASNIDFPNQLGARYIPLIFFLITNILIIRSQYFSRIWPLTLLNSSIGIAVAPEIGLVVFAATLAVCFIEIRRKLQTPFKKTLFFCCLSLLTLLLTQGILTILKVIFEIQNLDLMSFVLQYAKGYSALEARFIPISVGIIVFAIYELIEKSNKMKLISPNDRIQIFVSTIILGWLVYFFNRMDSVNLWFPLFLCFLVLSFEKMSKFSLTQISALNVVSRNLLIVILSFATLQFYSIATQDLNKVFRDPDCVISNYQRCLPEEVSRDLDQHLALLLGFKSPSKAIVLSYFPTEVRVMGFNRTFPWRDPFSQVMTQNEINEVGKWLDQSDIPSVVVENPESTLSRVLIYRSEHFMNIMSLTTEYAITAKDKNWLVYSRIESDK